MHQRRSGPDPGERHLGSADAEFGRDLAHGRDHRATFARRFTAAIRQPPLAYLTWWRLRTAANLLRDTDVPLDHVATRVGYSSQYAFANAFKRDYGVAPGRFRRAPVSAE